MQRQLRDRQGEVDKTNVQLTQSQERADQLEKQLANERQVQSILKQRVDNLKQENDRLHTENMSVVMNSVGNTPKGQGSVLKTVGATSLVGFDLSKDLTGKLQAFAKKYEGVEYDPTEKVCRFSSDLMFVSGGDRLRNEAQVALVEFAELMNDKQAKELNLLIVGHTSSETVIINELAPQHPTDWHLGAHQAIAVQQYLEEKGMNAARVGIVSYAGQQPLVRGDDDVAKRKNARLEIFLLPPDPPAGG